MSRRLPFLFLNVAHFLTHYFLLIFPTAVLAIHREWGAPYGETLSLGTAAFVALALGTLPAGWLGDRWRRSHLIVIFFVGLGGASILAGFAAGPLTLAAGLALIGLFAAIYHPVAIAAVVQLAEGSGRAIAVNGVWGNMGFAGAAIATGLLTEAFGWRTAFLVPGVVAVLLGIAAALFMGRSVDVVRASGKQPAAATADRRRAVLRVFVFIAVSAVFGGLVFNGITVALPKLFEEQLGSWSGDIARVGVLTALAFAVAAFAQLPVGALLDRHGAKPVVVTILVLQVPLLVLVGQAFGPAALPVAIGALLLVFGEIPVTDWLLGRYVAGPWQSRVYAVSDLGGLGVSVVAVPAIAFLHELSGGFALMFLLLAAASATACAAALWLPSGREAAVAHPLESASHPPLDDAHRPLTAHKSTMSTR
jgi:MFS family permease